MRISNNLFLARANLKGSKKKNTVMVMMILSVISITLLVGFLGSPGKASTVRLRWTPSSMALTGQTDVQRPHRVQVFVSHSICQGRSLTLSVDGVMTGADCIW